MISYNVRESSAGTIISHLSLNGMYMVVYFLDGYYKVIGPFESYSTDNDLAWMLNSNWAW